MQARAMDGQRVASGFCSTCSACWAHVLLQAFASGMMSYSPFLTCALHGQPSKGHAHTHLRCSIIFTAAKVSLKQ